jgi:hypothetical protein
MRTFETISAVVFALALTSCAASPRKTAGPGTAPGTCAGPPGPGCAPGAKGSAAGTPHAHGMAGMEAHCPAKVPGTTVQVVDLERAVALDFTTTGDMAEVRRRAARMAQMHGESAMHAGMMHGGMMGSAGGPGMMHGMMGKPPASSAQVEELPNGARIVLTPKEPRDLEALRAHAHQHAAHGQQGGCPMMARHAEHTAPAPSAQP